MQFGMSSDDDTKSPGLSLMSIDAEEYAVLSEESKRIIDQRTERLLHEAYIEALAIIKKNEPALRSLADALVEHETLNSTEIKLAIDGKHEEIRDARAKRHAKAKLDEERRRNKSSESTS